MPDTKKLVMHCGMSKWGESNLKLFWSEYVSCTVLHVTIVYLFYFVFFFKLFCDSIWIYVVLFFCGLFNSIDMYFENNAYYVLDICTDCWYCLMVPRYCVEFPFLELSFLKNVMENSSMANVMCMLRPGVFLLHISCNSACRWFYITSSESIEHCPWSCLTFYMHDGMFGVFTSFSVLVYICSSLKWGNILV